MTFIACAALLASAVAFTGCKGDQNAPEKQNEVVKTQFSIALPNQLSGPNRMPGTTVQRTASEFQGMTGITLIPFAKQSAIESTDTRLGTTVISLTEDVSKANLEATTAKAKVYDDVAIPLTTGSFLFYAKSKATGDEFNAGALVATPTDLNANPASIKFDLKQIHTQTEVANYMDAANALGKGGKLMQYLTRVACAEADGVKWYEYTANAGLQAMFTTFSTMHGLSSFEVERVLTDLYKSLKPFVSSNTMAAAISAAIKDDATSHTYATVNASDEVELVSDLDNFPAEFNLPEGSIDMAWNETAHEFRTGAYSGMAEPHKYVYPAQLWYYVNSTIKTADQSRKGLYDNDAAHTWDFILGQHNGALAVNSKTRAVAIKDPIQYAVARLDVAVKLNNATLADNSLSAEGLATDVTCPTGGFPITAILVGGQKQVNYDFTVNPSATTEYTIYDKVMTVNDGSMKANADGYSVLNHTLVLENGTGKVRIAVEMTNTTTVDFYGYNNMLIPAGGKFYVVAELDPTDAAARGGAADKTDGHVFKQDFNTIARLTLKDLKHAYNTIPDLRTPELELGFSVNLEWQEGNTYTINFEE